MANERTAPELVTMTDDDRAFLERRRAWDRSAGRWVLVAHAALLLVLAAIALPSRSGRTAAPLFTGAIVASSALGWFVYEIALARRVGRDLEAGRVAIARTRLVRKRLEQRKAGNARCLYVEPPWPGPKAIVSSRVYDTVSEGDSLAIRYFPASKILIRVERI